MTRKGPDALPDDRVRLLHMRDAAREALGFVQGRTREDLDTDAMFRRALASCIQEIGEAAFKMSAEGQARAPEIPWAKIIGSRHILVHAYFNIDLNVLWRIANEHVPELAAQVERVLPGWPEHRP